MSYYIRYSTEEQKAYTYRNHIISTPVDTYWDNVSLFLRFDEIENTFVDLSNNPKQIISYGNATQSNTQYKWGNKSLYLDGDGDYLTSEINNDFEFGTEDFVVDFWIRPNSLGNWTRVIGIGEGVANNGPFNGWSIAILNNGTLLRFYRWDGSGEISLNSQNISLSIDTWYYIAFVRSQQILSMYLNGSRVGVHNLSNSLNRVNEDPLYIGKIGGANLGGDQYLNAYIDDLRITKGVNRNYVGENIPVPLSTFPNGGS